MSIPETLTIAHGSPQFRQKPAKVRRLINEALLILLSFGVPITESPRRLERMALAFLAVADVTSSKHWVVTKHLRDGRAMRTRDIIQYINTNFGENISSGSYDDIRRKDLRLPVMAKVVVPTNPTAAQNDSTRGYAIGPGHAALIRRFGSSDWTSQVQNFMRKRQKLAAQLSGQRDLALTPVRLSQNQVLQFGPGVHNKLIKAVIEEFLPRYGHGAEILYVGDAQKRLLHVEIEKLRGLGFFELGAGVLPDVVAFSEAQNWLFLVEAVHTSGPVAPTRHLQLKEMSRKCTAPIIYVTAFADRASFRRHVSQIAWETEVWIAAEPDHLVHFDGEKFLEPYSKLE